MKSWMGFLSGLIAMSAASAWAQAPAAAPAAAPGQCGARPALHRAGAMMMGMFHQLNLTPEQKEQIKQLMQQHREQNKATLESAMTLRKQLREAMGSDNPDPAKIESLHQQLGALEGKLAASRAEGLKAVKALLTPEQQAQLAKDISGARERMEAARKRWQERGGPRGPTPHKTAPQPAPSA